MFPWSSSPISISKWDLGHLDAPVVPIGFLSLRGTLGDASLKNGGQDQWVELSRDLGERDGGELNNP